MILRVGMISICYPFETLNTKMTEFQMKYCKLKWIEVTNCRGCERLRVLSVRHTLDFTDECLEVLVVNASHLRSLDVCDCWNLMEKFGLHCTPQVLD